jgi:hypothetical protein
MPKPIDKWRFAIGTTSRVPNSGGIPHYFIADFDGRYPHDDFLNGVLSSAYNIIWQRTPHGWHLYTDLKMSFEKLTQTLKMVGADPAWVRIGKERGYYFLADKSRICFPWPVEHMVIHHGKEKAQNTSTP